MTINTTLVRLIGIDLNVIHEYSTTNCVVPTVGDKISTNDDPTLYTVQQRLFFFKGSMQVVQLLVDKEA